MRVVNGYLVVFSVLGHSHVELVADFVEDFYIGKTWFANQLDLQSFVLRPKLRPKNIVASIKVLLFSKDQGLPWMRL